MSERVRVSERVRASERVRVSERVRGSERVRARERVRGVDLKRGAPGGVWGAGAPGNSRGVWGAEPPRTIIFQVLRVKVPLGPLIGRDALLDIVKPAVTVGIRTAKEESARKRSSR